MDAYNPPVEFDFTEIDVDVDERKPGARVIGVCGLCGTHVSRRTARAAELAAHEHLATRHANVLTRASAATSP